MIPAQLITPNLDPVIYVDGAPLIDWLGWCLGYVISALNVPGVGATAWEGWTNTPTKHTDRNLPADVWVAIWFEHWGTYNGVYQNWGHVALCRNGTVYSSPISHKASPDVWPSIEAVEANYRSKFVGWSEGVGNTLIVNLKGASSVAIIEDNDYWRARADRTKYQMRGFHLDQGELDGYIGQDFIVFSNQVSDSPEADQATTWQEVGRLAVTDNWQQQIYTLQATVQDAQANNSATKAQLAEALDKVGELTDKLAASAPPVQTGSNPVITAPTPVVSNPVTPSKTSLLTLLKQLLHIQ